MGPDTQSHGQNLNEADREAVLAAVEKAGVERGKAAGGWYEQHMDADKARVILAGIEACDPALLDTFPTWDPVEAERDPSPDADRSYSDVWDLALEVAPGIGEYDPESFLWGSLMSYYEAGHRRGVEDEIARRALYQLEDAEGEAEAEEPPPVVTWGHDGPPVQRDPDGQYPSHVWPGGYPVRYITADNLVICPKCASKDDTSDPATIADVYYEGPADPCEDCNTPIESAYGDPDADAAPASGEGAE